MQFLPIPPYAYVIICGLLMIIAISLIYLERSRRRTARRAASQMQRNDIRDAVTHHAPGDSAHSTSKTHDCPSATCGVFTISRPLEAEELDRFRAHIDARNSPWCINSGSVFLYRVDEHGFTVPDCPLLQEHLAFLAEIGILVSGTVLLVSDSTGEYTFQKLTATDGAQLEITPFLTSDQRDALEQLFRMDDELDTEFEILSEVPPLGGEEGLEVGAHS